MMEANTETHVERLIKKCTGQQIHLPDLFSLSPEWKPRLNPNYDSTVVVSLDEWRLIWVRDPKLLKLNRRTNLPEFVRNTYPDTGLEELKTLAKVFSWIFFFDDALDLGNFKNLTEERKIYRDETINCIQQSLLGTDSGQHNPDLVVSSNQTAQAFYELGLDISRSTGSVSSKKFICHFLCEYVRDAVELDALADSGKIHELNSYMEIRMNTSAGYPALALALYANHINVPDWVLHHGITMQLMKSVNVMLSLDNDIISFNNELKSGHVDNLIPLLVYHKDCNAQKAVDEATQMIHNSYLEFQRLENELLAIAPDGDRLEIERLLVAFRSTRVGLLNWHYASERYFNFGNTKEITITLGSA